MHTSDANNVRRPRKQLSSDGIHVVHTTYPHTDSTDRSRHALLGHLPAAVHSHLVNCVRTLPVEVALA
ncbi:hypothetical protein [Streptomyces pseudovenezuelae]|uniref:hypothetical protein n=1 Tax=Streptomyces pseudovenezuelae TaxID=67350 RepID=UPI0036E2552E